MPPLVGISSVVILADGIAFTINPLLDFLFRHLQQLGINREAEIDERFRLFKRLTHFEPI